MGSRSPHAHEKGQIFGGEWASHCKFRHTLRSGHLCKDGWTARDGIWVVGSDSPKESWVRWGSRSPYGMGKFLGKEETVVKYRNFLPWAVHKRLNRSACRFGCGLGWAEGITSSIIFVRWRQCALMGATWRIRLNRLAAVAMRPYVKLLWPLVLVVKVNCSSSVFNIIKSIWIYWGTSKIRTILEEKRLKVRTRWFVYFCKWLLLKKTSQFKMVCKDDSGYITQLKEQKSKNVILLSSTSPHSQCVIVLHWVELYIILHTKLPCSILLRFPLAI